MSSVKLPKKLSGRLDDLARRVRAIALYRTVARALFLVPVAALVCILIDSYAGLPGGVRLGMLAAWCLLLTREVVNVWRAKTAPIDAEAIAHAIEAEYPRMGERLTTAVELSRHSDESNGSPELIREVLKDAQTRAERLDFDRVFPKTAAVRGLWTAVLAFLVITLPLAFTPAAREYARRFFAPWHVPAVVVDYQLTITSGDPAVKRGDSVTLSGYVTPTKEGVSLPSAATLVVTSSGKEDRLAMAADESSVFRLKRSSVDGDFDYRIEAGLAVSETHHVIVVDPVTLSSARITVTPPDYAKPANDAAPAVVEGLAELDVLQHGVINFDLQFSPVPKSVSLEFTPEGAEKSAKAKQSVVCNAQGHASVIWAARQSGVFQLVAEGDRGIKSELPAQPLKVIPDEAPKFPRVTCLHDKSRNVRPAEVLTIECTATDDVAVSRLALEYRVNDGPVQTKVIASPALNTPQADGKITLSVIDAAKAGDVLEVRLAATDNRRVPAVKLEPQTTYFPPKDWAEFRVLENAAPLAEQDILQRKQEIAAKLTEIRDELKKESNKTLSLRRDAAGKQKFTDSDAKKLSELRQELEETANKLRDLADNTAVTPELRKLADAVRKLTDSEIRTAEQALAATKEAGHLERNKNLATADEALQEAVKKAEDLLTENDRLAKERLDKKKLHDLAAEQNALAEKAKTADAKDADDLKRKQDELQAKLKKLQEQSDAIQKALDAAKADEADRLAREAERLAKEIQDLNKAMEKTDNAATAGKLDELKKKQDELNKKAKELAAQTDNASRAAQTAPLKTDDAAKKALEKGDLDEAAKQQEKAAQELDRLAHELEAAAAKTRNPREAAKQLAQLQENLRERLNREAKGKPLDQLPPEDRDAMAKQQEAIEKAAAKLKTPAGDAAAEVAKQRATADAKKAGEALKQNSGEAADRKMQEAKNSLEQLANKLPSDEQRLAKAKEEINKLKQEQEKLRKEAEQAAKDNAGRPDELRKKQAEIAKKEAELAEQLKGADVPGQERRQDKAAAAMEKAASSMTKGDQKEAAKAQQAAKDELDRLEQALNGKPQPEPKADAAQKPPGGNADDADRLAKNQRELADATQKAGEEAKNKTGAEADQAKKKAIEDLAREQAELAKKMDQIGEVDGPKDRQQAEQAMADAKQELDRENFEGAVKKQRDAADALDRLSREARKEEARQQAERNADLPNQEQADAAKRLAEEQRQLRDEAMKANDELRKQTARKDNPAGELAKEQDQIAKQAQDLARKAGERQGEQAESTQQAKEAAQAADQGAKNLGLGEMTDAQKAGEKAKAALDDLAKANPGTESGQKAKELAQRQADVNKKVGELSKDTGAAKAQQQAREKELTEKSKDLGEMLDKMARDGTGSDNLKGQKPGEDAKRAGEQLKAAQEADAKNQPGQAKDARDQAAKSLEQAAKGARESSKLGKAPGEGDASPQAGDAVQKADQQMNQAGKQLGQGKPGQASGEMRDAARSLEQAADHLGQGKPGDGNKPGDGQPGQSPGNGVSPGGKPDLRNFPPDVAQHNGKAWGELPGEIRTKIIQQMSARYGEDYARNIKLYFESLAERK